MTTTNERPRILVTNDDGIGSDGLHVLAAALAPLGDVVVVAPDGEYSGSSASLGALVDMDPIVRRHRHHDRYEAWSLSGPPALCVLFARLGVFGGRFDLAVSGINPGANVGRAIYHSGTVGAATTARLGRMSAIAVSQEVVGAVEGQALPGTIENQHWDSAAAVAVAAATALLEQPPPEPVLLNINVPNRPRDELGAWRRTSIAALPSRTLQSARLEPLDGAPDTYRSVVVRGDVLGLPADTDGGAVVNGEVSLTWLTPITAGAPEGDGAEAAERRIAELLGDVAT